MAVITPPRILQGAVSTDSAPGDYLAAVTPDDSNDLPGGVCRALLVGTAGAAKLTDAAGNVVTSVPLQAGYNPLRVKRVWSTGTTASTIYAIY
jgi:hypothetical protein